MIQFWKNRKYFGLGVIFLLSILGYYLFAYDLIRTEYVKLTTLYLLLFLLSFKLINTYKTNFKILVILSILFRLVFLIAIPNLSQDFYRFIWDGRMILEGFNPYLYTPESFIASGEYPILQAQELYAGMGTLNGSHFTNYPPINQLCFAIAGFFTSNSILGSVMVMRVIIIFADIGTLYFGVKLLEKLNIPVNRIFWYILNPFIIIELTGNLHFEGVMVFFLTLGLYHIHIGNWKKAAIAIAVSISVKLIPLIFLPLLYKRLGFKKWVLFCVLVVGVVIGLFLPFFSLEFVHNYSKTVGLWFQKFEFNASIYYVFREVGYLFRGYNEIGIIGILLPIIVVLYVLFVSIFKNNSTEHALIKSMLMVLVFYFFTTTTMHPWYLTTPLLLSIFTKYRFVLVWSAVVFLSYLAYANTENRENLWIIALEYSIVFIILLLELFHKRTNKKILQF